MMMYDDANGVSIHAESAGESRLQLDSDGFGTLNDGLSAVVREEKYE